MPVGRLPSGLELGYETRGQGDAVLMIAGLGRTRSMWEDQAPALAERWRVVTFDNRGVGESGRPAGPFSASQMADDAAGLLDLLELERAHVVGASLGGLVAQELALSRPERVASLSLLCTHPGLPWSVPMEAVTAAAIVPDRNADQFERLLGAMRLAFGSRYWEAHLGDLTTAARKRLASLPSPEMWWAQAAAGASFSWAGRRLRVPTLIMTGDEDRIVPAINSEALADLIPGAELAVFPGAGHYFFQEQPEAVNARLSAFICRKETTTCPSRP